MNQYLNFSLEGKVALVTGASYGIGFAIASAFAAILCFYSIPNYFDLGKVTKQSCFDAAKIVQNRYKFCPIICKICYLIRFRTLKNSKSTR
jgi:hypothetical protein